MRGEVGREAATTGVAGVRGWGAVQVAGEAGWEGTVGLGDGEVGWEGWEVMAGSGRGGPTGTPEVQGTRGVMVQVEGRVKLEGRGQMGVGGAAGGAAVVVGVGWAVAGVREAVEVRGRLHVRKQGRAGSAKGPKALYASYMHR